MPTRPVFVLTLQPAPGVDGLRALRSLLKAASRRFGLRCLRVTASDAIELGAPVEGRVAGSVGGECCAHDVYVELDEAGGK